MEASVDSSIITNKNQQSKLKNLILRNSNVTGKNSSIVSLNESDSPSLGSITTITSKKNPFIKMKRINNENLSISACDTINDSASEKTSFILKSKNLFGNKVESSNNQFNIFFEDTTIVQNNSHNVENESLEENSSFHETRSNPFQTGAKPQKHLFNIEFDETKSNEQSQKISPRKLQIFQKPSLSSQNFTVTYDDSLTQYTQTHENSKKLSVDETINESHIQRKKCLFSKNPEKQNDNIFNADSDDPKISNDSEKINTTATSVRNFEVSYTSPSNNKENLEQSSGTLNNMPGVSRAARELQDSAGISAFDSEDELHNFSNVKTSKVNRRTSISSLNKNLSKNNNSAINSEVHDTQSTYYDDNLDNWMSAESDTEMPPPEVSPVQSNFVAEEETSEVTEIATAQKTPTSLFWEDKFNDIVSNASKKNHYMQFNDTIQTLSTPKKNTGKPCTKNKKVSRPRIQAPTTLKKPAPYVNKILYQYIINKIKPKFGIDSNVKAEELVLLICETAKIVTRKKDYQKKLIEKLKKEMALAGLIETTVDFNEFVIKFLPYNFRVKVVPCLQPLTNTIYPPRDTINPFDKII